MKINILLLITFISSVFYAFSGNYRDKDLIGCTELNGDGCVCHSVEPSPDVLVWVEGPDTLYQGQTAVYQMYMTGGPAIAGGYNVAVRNGVLSTVDSLSFWDYRTPFELTQAFPLPFQNTQDTIYWNFAFTAGAAGTDTVYSCGLSTNWDSIPDFRDLWAYGPKYPVIILPEVPVEFISFTAENKNGQINLNWSTATETNNKGFEIQRSINNSEWNSISFINGRGTSTEINNYNFIDQPLEAGVYYYRLKQMDFNGSYEYSPVTNAEFNSFNIQFTLEQNYPNPFNPVTRINYSLPADDKNASPTILKIYDMLGNEVAVLVNEYQSEGIYDVEFNAAHLSSGIYLYKLERGNLNITRKLVLLK